MFNYNPTAWGIDAEEFFAERKEFGVANADSWNFDAFLAVFAYNISKALTNGDVIVLAPEQENLLRVAHHIIATMEAVEDSTVVEHDPGVREAISQGFYGMILPAVIQSPLYVVGETDTGMTPEEDYTREKNNFTRRDLTNLGKWILQVTSKGFDFMLVYSNAHPFGFSDEFTTRVDMQKQTLDAFIAEPSTYLTNNEARQNFLTFLNMEFNRLWT